MRTLQCPKSLAHEEYFKRLRAEQTWQTPIIDRNDSHYESIVSDGNDFVYDSLERDPVGTVLLLVAILANTFGAAYSVAAAIVGLTS